MSYQLQPDSVTAGLERELNRIFPGVPVYRESVPAQDTQYPCFFVHQLTQSATAERRNHWLLHYLAEIRYHNADDPAVDRFGLLEQLDTIGLALLAELTHIIWDARPVPVREPYYEKIEGVLYWRGSFNVIAKIPTAPDPMQEQLKVTTNLPQDL